MAGISDMGNGFSSFNRQRSVKGLVEKLAEVCHIPLLPHWPAWIVMISLRFPEILASVFQNDTRPSIIDP